MSSRGSGPRRWLMAAAVVSAIIVGAGSASNAAKYEVKACTTRALSKPFSPWGDTNSYFLAPSGSFEYGLGTWTVAGSAWTVAENEPWRVNGANDWASMQLLPGSTIRSRSFCVGYDEDSIRLFLRKPGVPGSALTIRVIVTNPNGTGINTYTVSGENFGWGPSPRIMMPNVRDANGQQTVTIEILPANNPAVWLVDDVMVDPWRLK
jgi:hypothetical protein